MTPRSSMFTTSSMGAYKDRNPAIRIYYLDPVTFTPIEYDHYFMNLTATEGGNCDFCSFYQTAFSDTFDTIFNMAWSHSDTSEHYYLISRNFTSFLSDGTPPSIELMYNTFTDYGMVDLSLTSLSDFIDRCKLKKTCIMCEVITLTKHLNGHSIRG